MATEQFKNQKLLKCKDDIKDYIGYIGGQGCPISDHEFDAWRDRGMPMRHINGSGWFAWTENINEFFRNWTGVIMREGNRK